MKNTVLYFIAILALIVLSCKNKETNLNSNTSDTLKRYSISYDEITSFNNFKVKIPTFEGNSMDSSVSSYFSYYLTGFAENELLLDTNLKDAIRIAFLSAKQKPILLKLVSYKNDLCIYSFKKTDGSDAFIGRVTLQVIRELPSYLLDTIENYFFKKRLFEIKPNPEYNLNCAGQSILIESFFNNKYQVFLRSCPEGKSEWIYDSLQVHALLNVYKSLLSFSTIDSNDLFDSDYRVFKCLDYFGND